MRSVTVGKINLYPGMAKGNLRWMSMLLCHVFGLQTWAWSSKPKRLVELRFHLRFEGELDALDVFEWKGLETELCTGRQRGCIGRDLSVVFQIWVQDYIRWLEPSRIEELSKYLTKKVRGTGCGIRYVRKHMPAGEEEEGSLEFELTKWSGLPLIRTASFIPRRYINWYVSYTIAFVGKQALLTVCPGDRRLANVSCDTRFTC